MRSIIDSLDDIRSKIDSTMNLAADSKARGHRSRGTLERQRPQIDENNYQMFPGRHTATAKSTRNHRFQLQSMRRPTSHTKQRFEHLTPR